MAYNSNTPKQSFTATSGQTEFDFDFKIFNESDMVVYKTPSGQSPSDIEDLLTITSDYTVSITGDDGGTVTLTSGASNGDTIVLLRSIPISREVDYQQGGDILADTLDDDQDLQTYLIADISESTKTSIRLPNSAVGIETQLPDVVADSYLRWNATGDALENDTTIPDSVNLAKRWANEDEDVVVADGEYSSKHYSIKSKDEVTLALNARNQAEQYAIAAEASADRAESFDPLTYRTDTPTLSGSSTVTELNDLIVTITNYDADSDYEVSATNGTVVRVGDTITVTTTSVTEDTSATLNVTALKNGYLLSATAPFNFTVLNVPTQNDTDAYIDVTGTDFNSTNFPTVVNGNVDNDYLIATADNCEATSSIVAKADADGDWNGVQDTSYVTSELNNVLSSADATDVVVQGEVLDGDVLYVGDSTNFAEVTASGVEYYDTEVHDFFGDTSAVATYQFNGDVTDLGGTYNGTVTLGTETYGVGKFGQAFSISTGKLDLGAGSKDLVPSGTQNWSMSCWYKRNGTGRNVLISRMNSAAPYGFILQYDDDKRFDITFATGSNSLVVVSTDIINTFDDGEFHHVVLSVDKSSNNGYLYIDGILIYTMTTVPSSDYDNNLNTLIGGYHNVGYSITIDQVRFFNRALNLEEMQNLYNVGKTKLPHNQAYTPTFACNKDNVDFDVTVNSGTNYTTLTKDVGEYVSGAGTDTITIKENFQAEVIEETGTGLGFKVRQKESGTKTTAIFAELTELGA